MIIQSKAQIGTKNSKQEHQKQESQYGKILTNRISQRKLTNWKKQGQDVPLNMNQSQVGIMSQNCNNVLQKFTNTKIQLERMRKNNLRSSLDSFGKEKQINLDQSQPKHSSVSYYQKIRKLQKQRKEKVRLRKVEPAINKTQGMRNHQSSPDKQYSGTHKKVPNLIESKCFKVQDTSNQYDLFSQYEKGIQQKRQKDRSKAGQNFYIKIKKLQSYDKWKHKYHNQTQNSQPAKNKFFSSFYEVNQRENAQSPRKQNLSNFNQLSSIEQTRNKSAFHDGYSRNSMSQAVERTGLYNSKYDMKISKDNHNIKKVSSSEAARLFKVSNRYIRMNINKKYSNFNSKDSQRSKIKAAINSFSKCQVDGRMITHIDEQFQGKVHNLNLRKYEHLAYQKGRQTPQRWDVYNSRIANFIENLGVSLNR